MLPFLKRKDEASASGPVDPIQKMHTTEDEQEFDPLESAMEELCAAIERKDYKAAAEAFRASFDLLEMQPHDEIDHGENE